MVLEYAGMGLPDATTQIVESASKELIYAVGRSVCYEPDSWVAKTHGGETTWDRCEGEGDKLKWTLHPLGEVVVSRTGYSYYECEFKVRAKSPNWLPTALAYKYLMARHRDLFVEKAREELAFTLSLQGNGPDG